MHEVFINYRTGDGDEAATLIDKILSDRFGKERIFLAAKSIAPGEPYPERLLDAVRGSAVLLAIMGPDWPHHPQLRDENDWVRREILEAYAYGIPVIPIMKGRKTDRLNVADLPAELAQIADLQSLRLDTRDNQADLVRIGDELANLVRSLKETDPETPQSPTPGTMSNSVDELSGTGVQGRDITGDIGTKGNQPTVHMGKGNINQNSPQFAGDGATYVQGDSHGGIRHHFGGSHSDEGDR